MADPRSIREVLLEALTGHEVLTRRVLERVPQDRWDWTPHPKSTPMGRLAAHVAILPRVVPNVLTTETFDMTKDAGGMARLWPESAADLLPGSERAFGVARAALEAARDDDLFVPWTLRAGERVLLAGRPRHAAIRTVFAEHLVHHRAQLGVYLRLCDLPVPSVYGPSADEPLDV